MTIVVENLIKQMEDVAVGLEDDFQDLAEMISNWAKAVEEIGKDIELEAARLADEESELTDKVSEVVKTARAHQIHR